MVIAAHCFTGTLSANGGERGLWLVMSGVQAVQSSSVLSKTPRADFV